MDTDAGRNSPPQAWDTFRRRLLAAESLTRDNILLPLRFGTTFEREIEGEWT
jgi:hypothetical protein